MRKPAYVHTIHLFILWYVSLILFKNLEICKQHEIPYEKLVKFLLQSYDCYFTKLFKFEIEKYCQIICAHNNTIFSCRVTFIILNVQE